ncbi:sialate O-acetylesterase [Spirosoma utsteinense]|uniref:Sialate O-acetylesterase n=1 Tax=Spirosoma utsteinense TaxID=2585773 RepID=A0ABR6W4Z5_9BACT|nr:sialate O-acetylesterase [Spirosoma utsteinense]MBC3786629.1 sialate O-acetylesterase [Spirosoma utsteinense]MBC3790992.1 sialate O-acetylesterase [Spirosoma utsteinense]
MKGFKWRLLIVGILVVQTALAEVRLPKVFGSHMVLQRRKPIPVWGWADAGEKITVTLASQSKTASTGKDGKWRVSLDPIEAGGPFQLVVRGKKNTVTYDDVLAGEVWLCSGQSNMEWPLIAAMNGKEEIKTANYPQIRQLAVGKAMSLSLGSDIEGEWTVCSPATAPAYTAVGYFFAKQLQKELNVPIGLINSSWGGTHSETWTSREAMNRDEELKAVAEKLPGTYQEVVQSGTERIRKLLQQQQGGLPTVGEAQTWADPNLNTSAWKSMNAPGDWEWGGLPTVDGVVWFRREVMVPETGSLKNVKLSIGSVDDDDSTYVNGQLVGSTKGLRARAYALPDGLLKPGRNVIVVRVADNGGGGGLMGTAEQLRLVGDNLDLPLAGSWQYRVASINSSSYNPGPNTYATQLFNAMINPLVPYAVAGAIWYQGESNAGRAYQYRRTFPLMIQDWRQHWKEDFPFLFVQLASFNASNGDSRRGSAWAELREAQTMTLQLPNTGMAITADIGEATDIHPKNKHDVGNRLAAEAMRVVYRKPGGPAGEVPAAEASRGPMLDKMTPDKNRAILTFRNAADGLMVKDKYGYLKGFEVAGEDQKFYYAKADVQGNSVIVHCDSVAAPVAVRYGWADYNGEVNLFNKQGFPAVPFRTDTWKGVTEAARFGQ